MEFPTYSTMSSYQAHTKPPTPWSIVEKTPNSLEKLQLLTQSRDTLVKDGYVLRSLNEQEIWKKMRCQNCGQKLQRYRPPVFNNSPDYEHNLVNLSDNRDRAYSFSEVSAQERYAYGEAIAAESTFIAKQKCLFHDGKTFKGEWQCCGGRFNTKGCCSNADHVAGSVDELGAEWLFYKTPAPTVTPTAAAGYSVPGYTPVNRDGGQRARSRGRGRGRYSNHRSSISHAQPASNSKSIRSVVALDCEMGTSRLGTVVLVRLSMVDFFTREPLIDSLVSPTVEMAHYNTRYSGVTFAAMRNAIRSNTAIQGTDAARNEVFKYVDSSTIVIVHGGSSDFSALRWIHPAGRIIDTCVLETWDHQVREQKWKRGLKDVCQRRCGITVQDAKLDNGRAAGHDSMEDALATREIVCWWLRLIPDQ